jgi:hypothetical protein
VFPRLCCLKPWERCLLFIQQRVVGTQVAKDMYDAKDAEFAMRIMKSSIVRAQICMEFFEKAGKAFAYLESWQNSFASMLAIGTVCFFMIFPQYIIPAILLGIITKCVMTYPSSFDKQVRRE